MDCQGAAEDVDTKRCTASIPRFSTDAALGAAAYEDRQVFPSESSGVRTLGSNHLSNGVAACHANRFSHRSAHDAACSGDTLAASLPSFYGVGWAEEQGKRSEMEDGTVVIRDFGGMPGAWLLAIYDGHGGRATVSLLLQRLHENLLQLLQERGDKRWDCLKRQAQCRRSVLMDSLNVQQQRLHEQLRCKSQRRQRRQCLQSHGEAHFRPQEGKNILVEEYIDTQVSQHNIPESDSVVEEHVVDQEIQERIDCYWQLLRTQQLLRVLRWIEETGENPTGDIHSENDACSRPHYLLVCTEDDVRSAFSDAFRQTDEQLLQNGIVQSGATACVSLLRPSIDFERLVTMRPEEFTDHDWQLFCGSSISFPLRRGRCDEAESADHDRGSGGVLVRPASYSQPSATVGGRPLDDSTPRRNGAKQTHDVPQADASQASKQHDNIHCVLSDNSTSGMGSSPVDASRCVYHSSECERGTTKTRALSSLLSIKLSVAHLGDSRALLVALDGSCERLTAATDHKASSFQEVQRVEEAGGWVFGERVNGMLAIGRAFGDWCLKLNPEELKVFSAAALTGISAEKTGDCDEKVSGRDKVTEPNTASGCKDSIDDKAILNMLHEGIGGFLSNNLDTAGSILSLDDEEGTGGNQEAGEASDMRLSAGGASADRAHMTERGRSLASHNHSSRQHALIVSNEPDICTRDILAYQGTDWTSDSAVMAVGRDEGVGNDMPATLKSDNQKVQDASYVSSAQRCGVTCPPVLLVLGCDGLFDVCSDHAVTAVALEFLRELQEAHPDLSPSNAAEAVARALIEEAITFRGSTDNVSVTVALLLPMDFCGNHDSSER